MNRSRFGIGFTLVAAVLLGGCATNSENRPNQASSPFESLFGISSGGGQASKSGGIGITSRAAHPPVQVLGAKKPAAPPASDVVSFTNKCPQVVRGTEHSATITLKGILEVLGDTDEVSEPKKLAAAVLAPIFRKHCMEVAAAGYAPYVANPSLAIEKGRVESKSHLVEITLVSGEVSFPIEFLRAKAAGKTPTLPQPAARKPQPKKKS